MPRPHCCHAVEAERLQALIDVRFEKCCALNGALRRWADELDEHETDPEDLHLLTDEGVQEFSLAGLLRHIATMIGTASVMRP